jgi:catechol 2,3-dioxygenase-like lactoylglutathione lyase family enzyme
MTGMPRPTHIAETALHVEDIAGSIRFYTDLFQCPVLRRDERFASLRIADEQVLLLFRRGSSTQKTQVNGGTIPPHGGTGQLHVCFGIQPDEMKQWEQRLAELNIAVESRVLWPGGAISLYFRDPDRHLVELATPGLWA